MNNQKILIVDDGKAIRMQVRDMLPKGNFEVLEAQDGLEGLHLIRQERPTLVLLDFFMPKMNGWEVVEQLRAQPDLHHIPLVIMSGRKEEVTEKLPDLFHHFEFIEKPFDQRTLIGAVKAAMARSKTASPAPVTRPPATAPTNKTAPPSVAPPATTSSNPADTAEIQRLTAQVQDLTGKMTKMQTELELVKKQMAQMMAFIKQKLA